MRRVLNPSPSDLRGVRERNDEIRKLLKEGPDTMPDKVKLTPFDPTKYVAPELLEAMGQICGYPLPGWRLDHVQWDEREGQPDGWIVCLKRERPDFRTVKRAHVVMARSDLGPLEAWDEALQIVCREEARIAEREAALADTHPQGGDVKQAPFMSGAVGDSRNAQPSGRIHPSGGGK